MASGVAWLSQVPEAVQHAPRDPSLTVVQLDEALASAIEDSSMAGPQSATACLLSCVEGVEDDCDHLVLALVDGLSACLAEGTYHSCTALALCPLPCLCPVPCALAAALPSPSALPVPCAVCPGS